MDQGRTAPERKGSLRADELHGRRIAIIAADGVEQVELERPRDAVEQAGATTELLSLQDGDIQAMNHDLEPADRFEVDKPIARASVGTVGVRQRLVVAGGA
ncbi:MAG: hypothetical protein ACR2IP_08100 [Solirubrobacteraceae bacterium]